MKNNRGEISANGLHYSMKFIPLTTSKKINGWTEFSASLNIEEILNSNASGTLFLVFLIDIRFL